MMNDFTKEELQDIVNAFEHIKDNPAWRDIKGWNDALQKKIQSMIDSYSENVLKRIVAETHLKEAETLISHAMCLLEMK